jgi:hypothetical protein
MSELKNDLHMRKKESLLEHFNPKIAMKLSHPPTIFTKTKQVPKKLGKKSLKSLASQIRQTVTYHKKLTQYH